MRTSILNRKTNRQANAKTYFQRLMMLMTTIMVSTVLVGCDGLNGDDDGNNGNGKGRVLTNEEKKLVGDWVYGNFVPGMWYDLGNHYEEFRGSSAFASAFKFNADGTYHTVWVGTGSVLNGYGSQVGNWRIPSNGKLLLTNIIENYTDTKNPNYSTVNKKLADQTKYYVFKTNSKGQYGVSIENDAETAASPNEILSFIYVKH